jgi:hypothetical protein
MVLVAAFCVILLIARFISQEVWVKMLTELFIISYCAMLAWIVLVKTFSEGPITIYRIEGSIVVYLLIGLMFANLYLFIFHIAGSSAFKGMAGTDTKEFLYFSFTTLTTVGYGDITPAIPFTRSAANLEALIGQLYPAILIARLVSMEFSDRQ